MSYKCLKLPSVQNKLNYRAGLSGLMWLKDSTGHRLINPWESDPVNGIQKGCSYTRLNDITGFAGYNNRHVYKDKRLVIDASGVMRSPDDRDKGKPKTRKPAGQPREKRENQLKTMNAPKLKSLVNGAVNFLRHRLKGMPMHFFTISFPPCVCVKKAKQFLNIWLTRLTTTEKIFMHLWVMEFQKNGTPHFHLLIPGRLNVRLANRLMSVTLANAARKKEIDWTVAQAKRYNGVDIQKDKYTRQVTNFADPRKSAALIKYLSKYISKNNAPSEYQRWHCSREWARMCTAITMTADEAVRYTPMTDYDNKIESAFFEFYRWNKNGPPAKLQTYLADVNYEIFKMYFIIDGNKVRKRKVALNPENN
jgi:hypothetical protein